MDPQLVKYLVLGVVAFAVFCVVPIVMALLAHQQKMAELFAKQNLDAAELIARIEMLERRLASAAPPLAAAEDEIRPRLSSG